MLDERGVRVLGKVSEARQARRAARADVLCAPSLHGESFGMVLTEAFAAGTPVVASDIPGYRDVVRDGTDGLLVPRGDPLALAEALRALALDPAAARADGRGGARARRAIRLAAGGRRGARGLRAGAGRRAAAPALAGFARAPRVRARRPAPARAGRSRCRASSPRHWSARATRRRGASLRRGAAAVARRRGRRHTRPARRADDRRRRSRREPASPRAPACSRRPRPDVRRDGRARRSPGTRSCGRPPWGAARRRDACRGRSSAC